MNQSTTAQKELISIERLGRDKFQLNLNAGEEILSASRAVERLLEMEDSEEITEDSAHRIRETMMDFPTLRAIRQDMQERETVQIMDNDIIPIMQQRTCRAVVRDNNFYLHEIVMLAGLIMTIPESEHAEYDRILSALKNAAANLATAANSEATREVLNGVELHYI